MGHNTDLVEGRLSIKEYDIVVVQMAFDHVSVLKVIRHLLAIAVS